MRGHGTMLAFLDVETRVFHAEADRSWAHLLESDGDSRPDYMYRLAVSYGFEAPFEIVRRYMPSVAERITVPLHERAGLLIRALVALGWTAGEVTSMQCGAFALLSELPEALAWMYVIERSTLIQAEVRHVLASKFKDVADATARLAEYDSTANARRAELGIALDRLCVTEDLYKRVTAAARTGFDALVRWQRTMEPGLRRVG